MFWDLMDRFAIEVSFELDNECTYVDSVSHLTRVRFGVPDFSSAFSQPAAFQNLQWNKMGF
ncbi:hypothetical protein HanRHA438_Chr17g0803481 [Helianthus annuus]|nr:hypothetical protein HanIR_Chr17g0860721 [Helianthus annuus]KAJ0825462.1 hypothetical protein HanRHA438_Chr17g0803481 [Helianthus annuus]